MYSLRQKTWGVFIRPYIVYGGDRLVQRGALFVSHPCQNPNSPCPTYSQVKEGEGWMLYKDELLTSFSIVRERVKEIMDELGYSKNDIYITEIIPVDSVVTPLT